MAKNEILRHKRVLILDNEQKNSNDKTWCFWSQHSFDYQSAEKISWKTLEFKSDEIFHQEQLQKYKYFHVNSLDFYNETLGEIHNNQNFELKNEKVLSLDQEKDFVQIKTEHGVYTAEFAFNSVLALLKDLPPKPSLIQHFYGRVIKSKRPVFKDSGVRLMDFSFPNKDTVQFGYLLPYSPHEALIEYTEFSSSELSQNEYEEYFDIYVEKLGIADYEVLDSEKGQIPMTDYAFQNSNSSRILNLGTAGGFTKPTTGYTFKNIQNDVASIIKGLEKGTDFLRPASHRRFRFYDKLLLGIIRQHPEKVKGIMTKLFVNNSFERILRFLDEKSSVLDEIKIFSRLPWLPFLKQIFAK